MVCVISAICARPSAVRCRPSSIKSSTRTNFGTMVSKRSHRSETTYWSIRNYVLVHVLAVVIVTSVAVHEAHPEELFELFQASNAASTLRHDEPRRYLIAKLVAASPRPIILSDEANREASFSVYKAITQPKPISLSC